MTSLGKVLLKMTLYLCIYFAFSKNLFFLSLFKIDTLNFTIYILPILAFSLKTYVIILYNLISCDEKAENN